MLTWLTGWRGERVKAKELYGAVVTQARQPLFYTGLGVPDTVEGRYEVIVVHLFLLLERLRRDGEATRTLSRRVIEAFVTDMDDAMREMGVGDLSVPKKVQRAAAGFYERAGEYRAALEAGDPGKLAAALAGRLLSGPADARPAMEELLAAYVRNVASGLSRVPTADLRAGRVTFPPIVFADM